MSESKEVAEIINMAFTLAIDARFSLVTPELVLYIICQNSIFAEAFENCGGEIKRLDRDLKTYLEEYMDLVDPEGRPELSQGMRDMLEMACISAQNSGRESVELPHIIHAIYELEESYAVYYMRVQGVERAELLQELTLV